MYSSVSGLSAQIKVSGIHSCCSIHQQIVSFSFFFFFFLLLLSIVWIDHAWFISVMRTARSAPAMGCVATACPWRRGAAPAWSGCRRVTDSCFGRDKTIGWLAVAERMFWHPWLFKISVVSFLQHGMNADFDDFLSAHVCHQGHSQGLDHTHHARKGAYPS